MSIWNAFSSNVSTLSPTEKKTPWYSKLWTGFSSQYTPPTSLDASKFYKPAMQYDPFNPPEIVPQTIPWLPIAIAGGIGLFALMLLKK